MGLPAMVKALLQFLFDPAGSQTAVAPSKAELLLPWSLRPVGQLPMEHQSFQEPWRGRWSLLVTHHFLCGHDFRTWSQWKSKWALETGALRSWVRGSLSLISSEQSLVLWNPLEVTLLYPCHQESQQIGQGLSGCCKLNCFLLMVRKDTHWQGSIGKVFTAAAPSVQILGIIAAFHFPPRLSIWHLSPALNSLITRPHLPPQQLTDWKWRHRFSEWCFWLGLYLDTGVPCNFSYCVRGYFCDMQTVAQLLWGCAPSLPLVLSLLERFAQVEDGGGELVLKFSISRPVKHWKHLGWTEKKSSYDFSLVSNEVCYPFRPRAKVQWWEQGWDQVLEKTADAYSDIILKVMMGKTLILKLDYCFKQ